MKTFITIIFLTGSTFIGFGQNKFEKESRIQADEVPEGAVEYVSDMFLPKKIKWYREQGLETMTYEAKTKFRGNRLSIEFSKTGQFEDLEVKVKSSEIDPSVIRRLNGVLKSSFEKYKIQKIQIQYTGDPMVILREYKNITKAKDVIVKYEVVASAKVEGRYQSYEYLFNEMGSVLTKSTIIETMTDNLDF